MSKKIKINILKNHKGFTMVEMLVTITIFAAAITSATALFIAVVNSQMKSNVQRQTMQDVRYAMETITREVRMATGTSSKPAIEYDAINNILTLNNIPDYGKPTSVITKKFSLKTVTDANGTYKQLVLATDSGSGYGADQAITSNNISVNQFKIENIVTYTLPSTPTQQPRVTITLVTQQRTGTQGFQQSSTTLRTTISSRDYNYTQ